MLMGIKFLAQPDDRQKKALSQWCPSPLIS